MELTEPSSVASPSDPAQDPPAPTLPNNIGVMLHAVGILLAYGRHLIDTLRQRSAAPNFAAIAANFGTANLSTIFAHLNRGILRAAALERVLLARAATGRDIDAVERHIWTDVDPGTEPAEASQSEPSAQPAPVPSAESLPIRERAPRLASPASSDDPERFMPTLEELEREARRTPVGRLIVKICLDLAVVPALCHSGFWNELFDIMTWFGGSHNVARLMQEKTRRRQAFDKEQDRNRNATWDWITMSRDALRQVLGFFIGEPPINPLDPAAAIATAPP